jgi:Tol biopolymer transport system component
MTDERIDALLRRLDVGAMPDPGFVASTASLLGPLVRKAQAEDSNVLRRFLRDLRDVSAPIVRAPTPRWMAAIGLVGLALLVAAATAMLLLGANPVPTPGPLIVVVGGQVRAVDVAGGTSRVISRFGEGGVHVSRSPDGQLVAFWRPGIASDELVTVGVDGLGTQRLAEKQVVRWAGCIDAWSADSRYIASEVTVEGTSRIMVSDTVTGEGRLITPDGVVAHCPLWSPDGQWVAFTLERAPRVRELAVIGVDGEDMRIVSGDLRGFQVQKPNSWSPDGAWIYFAAVRSDAGRKAGRVYRAEVNAGVSAQLSSDSVFAGAPALSPDGKLVAYTIARASGSFDLYTANSDGSQPRLLLSHALNDGWSADGKGVLSRWTPPNEPGGLVVVPLDGTRFTVVGFVDPACPGDGNVACDFAWGQARP